MTCALITKQQALITAAKNLLIDSFAGAPTQDFAYIAGCPPVEGVTCCSCGGYVATYLDAIPYRIEGKCCGQIYQKIHLILARCRPVFNPDKPPCLGTIGLLDPGDPGVSISGSAMIIANDLQVLIEAENTSLRNIMDEWRIVMCDIVGCDCQTDIKILDVKTLCNGPCYTIDIHFEIKNE